MALRSYLHTTFDPRRIPGLQAWYDAADSASVTLDSGRVSQWSDKSGNARHATNTTSGSTQPSYSIAARNGLNVLTFAAASVQRLTVPSSTAAFNYLHNGTESYVVAASVYGTSSNPNTFYSLFGNNAHAAANIGFTQGYDDRVIGGSYSANNGVYAIASSGSGSTLFRTVNVAANGLFAAYDSVINPQIMSIQESVVSAGNATASQRFRVRINGSSELTGNTFTGSPTSSNATFNFQLGANGASATTLEGDICELMFFNQLPTAAARDLIRRYLGSKWGVTVG